MVLKRRRESLIHDYLYYAVIVVLAVIILSATLAFFTLQNIKEEREAKYIHELNRICDELSESFIYLEKSVKYTADKIIQSTDGDPEKIAYYMKKSTRFPRLKEDIFTWALFSFIDPNGYTIADSIHGVIRNPTTTAHNSAWLQLSRERPNELHFSDPDHSIMEEEIIKTGYGVIKNSNFIGTISVGFNISRLNQKINNLLSQSGVMFIFLDSNYQDRKSVV